MEPSPVRMNLKNITGAMTHGALSLSKSNISPGATGGALRITQRDRSYFGQTGDEFDPENE